MKTRQSGTSADIPLPAIWDYTDYRLWFSETFKARKAVHPWYSYGVLAQRAGFKARDYLLRVLQGKKTLSDSGAQRVAAALDLPRRETEYFLALVAYNQAKKDSQRELAWERVQNALARNQDSAAPRRLTAMHRTLFSEWQHLALRSFLELHPDPGNCETLGKALRPSSKAAAVRRSLDILEACGLVERRTDGLLHATDKSLVAPPDIGPRELRRFHRRCLRLASDSLEAVPVEERNVSGITLGISRRTYEHMCQRLAEIHLEFGRMAELDEDADRIYHLNLALFPMTHPLPGEVR